MVEVPGLRLGFSSALLGAGLGDRSCSGFPIEDLDVSFQNNDCRTITIETQYTIPSICLVVSQGRALHTCPLCIKLGMAFRFLFLTLFLFHFFLALRGVIKLLQGKGRITQGDVNKVQNSNSF